MMGVNLRPAIEALENGANEIERMRRHLELVNAQLDVLRMIHEITNPGKSQVMRMHGGGHPDAVYIMRKVAERLRTEMEGSSDAAEL